MAARSSSPGLQAAPLAIVIICICSWHDSLVVVVELFRLRPARNLSWH